MLPSIKPIAAKFSLTKHTSIIYLSDGLNVWKGSHSLKLFPSDFILYILSSKQNGSPFIKLYYFYIASTSPCYLYKSIKFYIFSKNY
jgi:hypothetical protein